MMSGMNWIKIDLDHVRLLSSFNLTDLEQLGEACHFSNYQPLLEKDIRKKSFQLSWYDLAVQREAWYEYELYSDFTSQ